MMKSPVIIHFKHKVNLTDDMSNIGNNVPCYNEIDHSIRVSVMFDKVGCICISGMKA